MYKLNDPKYKSRVFRSVKLVSYFVRYTFIIKSVIHRIHNAKFASTPQIDPYDSICFFVEYTRQDAFFQASWVVRISVKAVLRQSTCSPLYGPIISKLY